MNLSNNAWFILSLFVFLPTFLIFAWSWKWWRNGRYSFDKFDHFGTFGAYDFNSGYLFPRGPHRGTAPKNYHRSDAKIIDEISDRLMAHGLVDASDVEVFCTKGLVKLRGSVDSRRTRRIIEDVVESVIGVMDVDNQLKITTKNYPKIKQQYSENILHHH